MEVFYVLGRDLRQKKKSGSGNQLTVFILHYCAVPKLGEQQHYAAVVVTAGVIAPCRVEHNPPPIPHA